MMVMYVLTALARSPGEHNAAVGVYPSKPAAMAEGTQKTADGAHYGHTLSSIPEGGGGLTRVLYHEGFSNVWYCSRCDVPAPSRGRRYVKVDGNGDCPYCDLGQPRPVEPCPKCGGKCCGVGLQTPDAYD